MTALATLKRTLQTLQQYAISYFTALYKTIIQFWQPPSLPTAANILTGGFAFLLVYLARVQVSKAVDISTMSAILFTATLTILLVCGILVVFDRFLRIPGGALPVASMGNLVSVVCVGIILGCAFVVLDSVFPWIDSVFTFANSYELSANAANLLVSGLAAFLAFIVILTNSIFHAPGFTPFFSSARNDLWAVVILSLLVVGVNLLLK